MPWIKLIILSFLCGLLQTNAVKPKSGLSIAIIGAGAAGLATAKHALDGKHNVTIYEKMENFGGVWYYTDKTGNDSFGVPVHSPNYPGLRTNAPYQIMEYPDLHYPNGTKSYPTAKVVWEYMDLYAKKFKIKSLIKLRHLVENVVPLEKGRWRIFARSFPSKKPVSEVFDAVFVCTNAYSYPYTPDIDGINDFKGKKMHSHDFRKVSDFHGKEVLIIGGGPSGVDIAQMISKTVKRMTLSTNMKLPLSDEQRREAYGKNCTFKSVVERLTSNGADFKDGTSQTFNAVIFATGYRYEFPFLKNAGIHTDDNFVYPLFAQILNIQHPTMALIGIPFLGSNYGFSLEARFALKFITGEYEMPSKEAMDWDFRQFVAIQRSRNIPNSKIHHLGGYARHYYDHIAKIVNIEKIPAYYDTVFSDAWQSFHKDPVGFRNYKYIINGSGFQKVRE